MSQPIEAYFTELRDIRNSGGGVSETSYYGALASLLNHVGHSLKPHVRCLMQLRNLGAGMPDGGLFTQSQFGKVSDAKPAQGQTPARGVIEVKGTGDDVFAIAVSEQVVRYLDRYGLVLVTNLRDFVLVGYNQVGQPHTLESCRLSETEARFWARVQQPKKFADEAGEGLVEFLKRVMLHNAPLTDPKDLAWFLASYARTARLRLEQRHELPALAQLRTQLEEALGLEFEGEKGDHFFRSTLVQTLFYGVFAAWVLWSRAPESVGIGKRFEWELASRTLDVPMISALYYQFADPNKLKPLGIDEVLDWTEDVLDRVDRSEFFKRFREQHAVQYFYEPFLEAFDPQLRKELGVWYTPDEVVRYMVARVDTVLREELDIAHGLADPSVYVLDPCCGTGAYLVEVLRKIDETLQAKGADALTRHDVKRAAMERVIGFEIMPAPFVVAHLQLGLLLTELGVPLQHVHGEHERVAVYLTNALTGWNTTDPNAPGKADKRAHPAQLLFEFEQERDAAAKVKREAPILVVLGNPPYNGFAGVAEHEEAELIEPYKEGLVREWGIRKFNLDDLYVRFYRLAERTIAERGGRGVVSFITNSSWLSGPSFVVMRRRLVEAFDRIWIDNLNGDSRETGKTTPTGEPDPSVFSTEKNREGIQVGTAVAVLIRQGAGATGAYAGYRDFWGVSKRSQLVESVGVSAAVAPYEPLSPREADAYSLRPRSTSDEYSSWPSMAELCASPPVNGLLEKRRGALYDYDRESLRERMRAYFDSNVRWEMLSALGTGLTEDAARFDARAARAKLMRCEQYDEERLVPYLFRPFDVRWAYYSPIRPLWNEPRPSLAPLSMAAVPALMARVRAPRARDGMPTYFSVCLTDDHALHKDAFLIPFAAVGSKSLERQTSLLTPEARDANLSKGASNYLGALGADDAALWYHALAVSYSPTYCEENGTALQYDWPHVPLPASFETLQVSSDLGRRVACLLNPLDSAEGDMQLRLAGTLSSASRHALDPAADLALTARWGISGQGGAVMPSTGKLVEREYTCDELDVIRTAARGGLTTNQDVVALLGERCFDVYLNDVAYWRCVPSNVWRYTIGGYQVIKKWLSYREKALLGRDLKPEEARYVTEMVRRIAALVLMQPELDANYERVKADVWEWKRA